METPSISVKYVEDYAIDNVRSSVLSAINELGGIKKFVKPSDKVVIKANLCGAYSPDKAITTHPNVIRAIVEPILKIGAKCTLVDSSNVSYNDNKIDKVYEVTGMFDLALSTNIKLNKNFNFKTINFDGKQTKSLNILSVIEEATVIINVSKLKTSIYTGITGCVENLMGCVPYPHQKQIKSLYTDLNRYTNYLIDLEEYLHNKIRLNLVDAIVGMEGEGPINGTPRILNRIVLGIDPYLTDLMSLSLIGYPIVKMPLIVASAKRNKFPFYTNLIEDIKTATNEKFENMNIVQTNYNIIEKFSKLSEVVAPATKDFNIVKVNSDTKTNSMNKISSKIYNSTHNCIPKINKSHCRGCSICYNICPTHAITIQRDEKDELYANIDYSKCIYCYKCVQACCYNVITAHQPFGYKKIYKKQEK